MAVQVTQAVYDSVVQSRDNNQSLANNYAQQREEAEANRARFQELADGAEDILADLTV